MTMTVTDYEWLEECLEAGEPEHAAASAVGLLIRLESTQSNHPASVYLALLAFEVLDGAYARAPGRTLAFLEAGGLLEDWQATR
jgi:hypothetical protein